jgi:hypothetical protein
MTGSSDDRPSRSAEPASREEEKSKIQPPPAKKEALETDVAKLADNVNANA